jgi:hypothetical protein
MIKFTANHKEFFYPPEELTVLHLSSRNSLIAIAFCPYIMGEM